MKTHWKEVLSLLFLSPALIELLSGNTPASSFFSPFVLFILMTVGYGFVVLIIREVMVRFRFGLLKIFVLGVGYALLNEGLLARTIFDPFYSPIPSFAHYGLVDGIRLPWLVVIGSLHALYSVIFPIIFVHYLFPRSANEPWLGVKLLWVLGAISLLAGVVTFLTGKQYPEPGRLDHLLFIMIVWVLLGAITYLTPNVLRVSDAPPTRFTWRSPLLGASLLLAFFVLPVVFTMHSIPSIGLLCYMALLCAGLGYFFSKRQDISLTNLMAIVLGAEIALSLFSLLGAGGSVEKIVTACIFLVIFCVMFVSVHRKAALTDAVLA